MKLTKQELLKIIEEVLKEQTAADPKAVAGTPTPPPPPPDVISPPPVVPTPPTTSPATATAAVSNQTTDDIDQAMKDTTTPTSVVAESTLKQLVVQEFSSLLSEQDTPWLDSITQPQFPRQPAGAKHPTYPPGAGLKDALMNLPPEILNQLVIQDPRAQGAFEQAPRPSLLDLASVRGEQGYFDPVGGTMYPSEEDYVEDIMDQRDILGRPLDPREYNPDWQTSDSDIEEYIKGYLEGMGDPDPTGEHGYTEEEVREIEGRTD